MIRGLGVAAGRAGEAAESKRMEHAKDLIADEQWVRAIDELKAAAADPKEPNKDEALFWLAHSLNQARDTAAAVETIPASSVSSPPAVGEAGAIAAHRDRTAAAAQRRALVYGGAARLLHRRCRHRFLPAPPAVTPAPRRSRPRRQRRRPLQPRGHGGDRRSPRPPRAAAVPPLPPPAWVPEGYFPDMDLRIQALASLIRTDALKVIPILKSHRARELGHRRRAPCVASCSRSRAVRKLAPPSSMSRRAVRSQSDSSRCASSDVLAVRRSSTTCCRCMRRRTSP